MIEDAVDLLLEGAVAVAAAGDEKLMLPAEIDAAPAIFRRMSRIIAFHALYARTDRFCKIFLQLIIECKVVSWMGKDGIAAGLPNGAAGILH